MVSANSEQAHGAMIMPTAMKILIAGGFGVGKTTMIKSVSEIPPLETEEHMTQASVDIDDLAGTPDKSTTTVAMDFGRITLDPEHVLYMFGTPGQSRFWFMWDDLALGSIGAVVLADPRRMADSYASVDFFEQRGIPFTVGVNCFYGQRHFTSDEIRSALNLTSPVPIVMCDVRQRSSSKNVLLALLEAAKVHAANRPAAVSGH